MERIMTADPAGPGPAEIAEKNSGIDRLVRHERKRLFDFIRRRIRSEADAEDILQDVFTQLVASTDADDPIEDLTSWLFTVAKNRVVDWYRRRKGVRMRETTDQPKPDGSDTAGEDSLADPDPGPDELTMGKIIREEIESALDELPEKQRSVFVMNEFEGKSFREIADESGEPLSTLLSRKRYAVLYLRERLKDLYDEIQTL